MAETTLRKNAQGYGYKYTDLAEIHNYLESKGKHYYQYIDVIDGNDYIVTVKIEDGKELEPIRGCRVVQATLNGVDNPAQEQGSALTYARRYSLQMAYGLCTSDDDAACMSTPKVDVKTTFTKDELYEKVYALADIKGVSQEEIEQVGGKPMANFTKVELENCIKWLQNK